MIVASVEVKRVCDRPASTLLPAHVICTIYQNLSGDMQFTSDSQILSLQIDVKSKVEMQRVCRDLQYIDVFRVRRSSFLDTTVDTVTR